MRCLKCGGEFIKERGTLLFNDKLIGKFTINNVDYRKCNSCSKLRFPAETAKIIESKKDKIENELIGRMPVNEFVNAVAASKIIGISRQAMHKNPRIRRGFIYSIKIDAKILYHIKSVELYARTGDGRFQLYQQEPKRTANYLETSQKPKTRVLVWHSPSTNQPEMCPSLIPHSIFMNTPKIGFRQLRKDKNDRKR